MAEELEIFEMVRNWAHDRNIINGGTIQGQLEKLREEVQELSDAIDKMLETDGIYGEDFADAIGDCIVVLTIMATMGDFFVEDCLEAAYDEIKDRKGKMVNGIFVKETE